VSNKKGFTLIELLVVIAIFAMLMSVLMPALAKARAQGKAVVCLSNLRQMFIASQSYAANHDDYYPSAYLPDPDPLDALMVTRAWDFVTAEDWNTKEVISEPGILWESDGVGEIQQCPSFKGKSNTKEEYSGYNYNVSYIGHGYTETTKMPVRVSDVANGASNAIFGDGQYYDGANKFMRSPFPEDGVDEFSFRAAGTQGYRHSNKTNVAWCDGHVSSQRELYTNTVTSGEQEMIEQHNLQNPNKKVGFLSSDNSAYDLK